MRSATAIRASAVTLAAAVLALAGPSAAHAADAPIARVAPAVSTPASTSASTPAACTISDATATWGVKESFRSYISGSIAKGSWEPFGGAGYATPSFTFTGGTGTFDPATATGTIAFPGGIRFTGHNGLLDTTLQNVSLELAPAGGRMLLDLSSVSMDSALAGDSTAVETPRVPFVTLDLASLSADADGGSLTLSATDAATAITAEGYAAFGSYETGTGFDPLSFTATGTCPVSTPTPVAAQPGATDAATPVAAEASDAAADGALPVALIASIGGGLVAVVAGTVAAVVAIRRRRSGAGGPTSGAAAGAPRGSGDGPAA